MRYLKGQVWLATGSVDQGACGDNNKSLFLRTTEGLHPGKSSDACSGISGHRKL